ncbi:hypothetical protein ACFWUQ_01545 [Streptomyces sp. NPDC058662]|uniref:hypothetical protein n=1 Tax=Streptomyces sp. NPDC058662 TaxID=3346583 RepID=UPI00365FF404
MKLKPYFLGALLPALLALSAPASASAAAQADRAAQIQRGHTAADISRFLSAFYGDRGPTAHSRENEVSQVLKDKQTVNKEVDVLLCAQNEPQGIGVGPVTVAQSAGVGWATVTTHWGADDTDTFTAYVRLDSRPIRLDDVICAG